MAERTFPRRALVPGALILACLAFVLPALALPAGRPLLAAIGLGTLALLGLAPLVFRRIGLPLDRILYTLLVILTGLGLAQMARLQLAGSLGPIAQRQLLWLSGGLVALGAGAYFGRSHQAWCHYRFLLLFLALAFLCVPIPFGVAAGGSRAWLRIGEVHLQPSELARPLILFFLASYLGQYQPLLRASGPRTQPLWRRRWLWGPILAMWGLALAVLLLQRDLGTAVLYYAAFLILLYLASGRAVYLLGGAGLGALGCLVAAILVPHVRARFEVWLHPLAFVDGAGFQGARSLFALAAGGLLGVGPGRGLPQSTPAVHTDLVFAAFGEELGLAGGLAILLFCLLLVARGLALASRSRDRVGFLFGAGLSFALGLQVLLIVGGTMGLLPLTGITLPLLSYGGSSLVSTLFCLGVLSGIGSGQGRRGLAD